MKAAIFITSIATFAAAAAFGSTHTHHDPASVHGMAVVGNNKIYLSHLPMYHSPHDYQVILEAELDENAAAAYKNAKASSNETLYTIAPEEFVLPEMVSHPHPFKAQLFQGHFERGGVPIVDATITIKKVLVFEKLQPEGNTPGATYYLFGNEEEQFLAHQIKDRPNFDQILSVKADGSLVSKLIQSAGSLNLFLLDQDANQPLMAPGFVETPGVGRRLNSKIQLLQTLYLERGDLSH